MTTLRLRYPGLSVTAARVSVSRYLSLGCGLAVLCASPVASADVSSWVFVGGGAAELRLSEGGEAVNPVALQLDAGFGSAPTGPIVVGFAAKTWTFLDHGTDLGLALRLTTGGYSRGTWGLALDLGATQRFWGETSKTLPSTSLSLGLPWGLVLAATAASDFDNAQSVVLTLGFDWARLTVHRTSGDSWWRNYRLPLADQDVAKR